MNSSVRWACTASRFSSPYLDSARCQVAENTVRPRRRRSEESGRRRDQRTAAAASAAVTACSDRCESHCLARYRWNLGIRGWQRDSCLEMVCPSALRHSADTCSERTDSEGRGTGFRGLAVATHRVARSRALPVRNPDGRRISSGCGPGSGAGLGQPARSATPPGGG